MTTDDKDDTRKHRASEGGSTPAGGVQARVMWLPKPSAALRGAVRIYATTGQNPLRNPRAGAFIVQDDPLAKIETTDSIEEDLK